MDWDPIAEDSELFKKKWIWSTSKFKDDHVLMVQYRELLGIDESFNVCRFILDEVTNTQNYDATEEQVPFLTALDVLFSEDVDLRRAFVVSWFGMYGKEFFSDSNNRRLFKTLDKLYKEFFKTYREATTEYVMSFSLLHPVDMSPDNPFISACAPDRPYSTFFVMG